MNKVKLSAPHVEMNSMDGKRMITFFENDENAMREYFENIVSTRPEMVKETAKEYPYDWDFEVDMDNYDPWKEYKMIYRDLFEKGRAHFILKSMPEWRFLQIQQPKGRNVDSISKFDPRRPNHRDSIFEMITNDLYFNQREKKEGVYKEYSQSVRI